MRKKFLFYTKTMSANLQSSRNLGPQKKLVAYKQPRCDQASRIFSNFNFGIAS
jgi:hypothetical protein